MQSDVGPHLLEPLLVLDPEALLLVDHQQAEVLELDILLDQTVGADHHVDAAGRDRRHHRALLLPAAKPRQHLDLDRERFEPLQERLEVLFREDGGRRQHGDLLAAHHRLERGAQRHLGLAEADVAADQPVHGTRRLHVRLYLFDTGDLVRGLLIGETRLELLLPVGVAVERRALHPLAARVELDEVFGQLLHRLAHLRLARVPRLAADAVQLRGAPVLAHVALDQVDLLDRHKDVLLAAELQVDVVALVAEHAHPLQAVVLADAVVDMHHVVARGEIHERVDRLALRRGRRARNAPLAPEYLVLLDHHDPGVRQGEAGADAVREDAHLRTAPQLAEHRGEALRLMLIHGEDQHLVAARHQAPHLVAEVGNVAEEGARRIAGQPQPLFRRRAELHAAGARSQLVQRDAARMLANQPRVIDQKRLGQRREVTARDLLAIQLLVFLAHRGVRGVESFVPRQHQQRRGRQNLQQARRFRKAQREEQLGAARIGIAAHRVQEQLAPLLRQRRLRQVGRQRVQLRPRHVHFARRVDRGALQRRYRALRGRLEFAQLFDGVEVEHRAHRVLAVVGIDVDHLALDRELAMDRHARHAHVAERHKLLLDLDRIELAADRQPEYPLAQVAGRRHRREQGAQRGDHDIDLLRGGNQLGEHAGAFAEHRRQRRRAGVGQQAPPREPPDPVAPAHRGRRGRGDADWTPAPDHGARYGRCAGGGRCRGQRCYDRRRPRSSAGRRLPAARQRLSGQAQVAGQQVGFLLGRRHHHQRPASGLPQPVQQQRRETALHPLDRRRERTAGNPPQ